MHLGRIHYLHKIHRHGILEYPGLGYILGPGEIGQKIGYLDYTSLASRHLRALFSVRGRCSFGGDLEGYCSACRVCVSVSGVLFSVGVCVCV